MIDLNLFRLKIFPSQQRELWGELSPPEILRRVIATLPSGEFRRGNVWHIGNVEDVGQNWTYFRLGKTSRTKVEFYSEGNFRDALFDAAPYTHVLVNYPYELIAIARKPKLSADVVDIANRLKRLLEHSTASRQYLARFDISVISDPETFIHLLRTAYSITRFSYEFDRQNIFDVDEDFFKPLERTIEAVKGTKGLAVLKGEALDPNPLEAISRSAAATGNEVTATVKRGRKTRKIRKKLRRNPVSVQVDDLTNTDQIAGACDEALKKYEQVRKRSSS